MTQYNKIKQEEKKIKSPREYTILDKDDQLCFIKNGWRVINVSSKTKAEIPIYTKIK